MGSPHPPPLLVYVDDGGSNGQVLQRIITRLAGAESGVPVFADHFQQGYGFSGAQLGLTGVGVCGRTR